VSVPNLPLNDGRIIPQLGFGVSQVSARQIVPTVSTALEVGYRHIDTASAYGNEAGVGQAIRESGIARDELFVTTKLGDSRHGDARAALEESLQRLDLDYLDLYLIHWPLPRVNKRVQAWHAMEQAQADGLVRSIGLSNFTPRYLNEILDRGSVVPAVNQIECHPTF
jgi:2,5-diketo-D-gluconate reductase A